MNRDELVKNLGNLINRKVEHSNLGNLTITNTRLGSDYVMATLAQDNGNTRDMALGLILDKLSDSETKTLIKQYSDDYTQILKDEKIEKQRIAEEKAKELEQLKLKEKMEAKRQKQIERDIENFNKLKATLNKFDYEHMDEEEKFLREYCSVRVAIPDYLENYFKSLFPDSHPYVVDTSILSSGGFQKQWSIGASLHISKKGREHLPNGYHSRINDKYIINDTSFVLGLVREYELPIIGEKGYKI